MKIYTAKGDAGKTSLLFGARVSKRNSIIECLGDLDELNAFIGLAKAVIKNPEFKSMLYRLQKDIGIISSEIAANARNLNKLQIKLGSARLVRLEGQINRLASKAKLGRRGFFIPGENFSSALMEVCRTICRRAERSAVFIKERKQVKNTVILAYLNRLSSLLFVLARLLEGKHRKFSAS